ncbi:MAG: MAPEG family protein [Pseudolabrys sp.]
MSLSITALYAGILALFIVALGINVTMHRVKLKVSLGDGGNPVMLRMIRLHGNAVEYLPLALVLMAIYEINGGWHAALHIIGIALVAGRLIQTMAMWSTDVPAAGRGIGQTLTWGSIAVLALLNLWKLV